MKTHVLLIGIDAYTHTTPLGGCAHDVDAVEAFLLARGAPKTAFTKLVSRPAGQKPTAIAEVPATLANLQDRLRTLATTSPSGQAWAADDRLLVWYAGHGMQVLGRADHQGREALVPVDFGAPAAGNTTVGVLWDVELNALLAAIAKNVRLTVVLDCCNSAGATRSLDFVATTSRGVVLTRAQEDALQLPPPDTARGMVATLATGSFNVVAACQADQTAKEREFPPDGRHGALTWSLLARWKEAPDLEKITWGEIWTRVKFNVASVVANQNPVFLGRPDTPVLGGAQSGFDSGITATRLGAAWMLDVGTLGGAAVGAELALYDRTQPARLPPAGSAEDKAARLGLVRVNVASRANAQAGWVTPVPAQVPDVARARIVTAAADDQLRVRLRVENHALRQRLAAERWLHLVEVTEVEADVEVRKMGDQLAICDAMFGPEVDYSGPLAQAPVAALDVLVDALYHARMWRRPQELARRANDLPGALRVRLLDELGVVMPLDTTGRYTWRLTQGTRFTIEVTNTSAQQLTVGLMDCTMSGAVELLADALQIPAGASQTIWAGQQVGAPFEVGVDPDRVAGVDRLVVVGTSQPGVSFASYAAEGLRTATRSMIPATPPSQGLWASHTATVFMHDPTRAAAGAAEARAVRSLGAGGAADADTPYERSEADVDAPNYAAVTSRAGPALFAGFTFSNAWMIPVANGQAVCTGWLPEWGSRPLGVTWHWGALGSLASLSAAIGGANAARRGEASAHYGVGRTFKVGVHRYVALGNRSWHAGKEQRLRWDGKRMTTVNEKCTRTTIGVETDHRGHVSGSTKAPSDWIVLYGSLGQRLKVQPWTEEQIVMMIAVGLEIQATWPHIGPRDHHGHADVCPSYKTDVTGFPFARVLRGIYAEQAIPDVWTPFWTIEGRQRALIALGHDLGPTGADGDWGGRSRAALAAFKKGAGLVERERDDDPVGGHWNTFVCWAMYDALTAKGLDLATVTRG